MSERGKRREGRDKEKEQEWVRYVGLGKGRGGSEEERAG